MKKVKSRVLTYTAVFTEEPEGGYTVVVHALPGCVTYGKTFEEARKMAKEAIDVYLESLAKHGEKAPIEHSPVTVPMIVSAPKNLQLYA